MIKCADILSIKVVSTKSSFGKMNSTLITSEVRVALLGVFLNLRYHTQYIFPSCLYLYAIDREYVWRNYLKKYYAEGKTILLDRYTTSSFIYQTLKCKDEDEKKDMIAKMKAYEYYNLGIGEPDLVIFFNGDFDTLTKLRLARETNDGVQKDIFEKSVDTQRKIYESAQFVSNYLKWSTVNVTKDNEMRSREDIHEDVMRLVRKLR